jgi:hypothetical protein
MKEFADNQYPYVKKLFGWKLALAWLGLLIIGWVVFGAIMKLFARLFFLGWDLV